jgi:hypothetical protein
VDVANIDELQFRQTQVVSNPFTRQSADYRRLQVMRWTPFLRVVICVVVALAGVGSLFTEVRALSHSRSLNPWQMLAGH